MHSIMNRFLFSLLLACLIPAFPVPGTLWAQVQFNTPGATAGWPSSAVRAQVQFNTPGATAGLPSSAVRAQVQYNTQIRPLLSPGATAGLPSSAVRAQVQYNTQIRPLLSPGATAGLPSSAVRAQVQFNTQIRPLLSRHCTACHGPDEASREADLRLDTFAGATADLGDYAAIVPGDPEASELMTRVLSPHDPMPPAEHGQRLTTQETELLRQWILEGASYQKHWAFVKPERPTLPVDAKQDGSLEPIDRFVWQTLQQQQLRPNPPADPARLVRRLALDLTGLPPTQTMVDTFVAQPSDANWERLVDQLLADPAYGEHWASVWLDLARYADTVGYAGDEKRTIWPWRDWLIKALNRNQPYDEFTTELLAGDLLPQANAQQRLATAFHRNTLSNNEGGTNDEEFRTVAIKDRLSTTLSTWMGLTVRCAECHSHKYDPISHQEYYQLLDFFNQTGDADQPNEAPTMDLLPDSLRPQQAATDRQIASLRESLSKASIAWQNLSPSQWEALAGTQLKRLADGSLLATGPNPNRETYVLEFAAAATVVNGLKIEVLPDAYHSGSVGRGEAGSFVMTQLQVLVQETADGPWHPLKLQAATADHAQANFGAEHLIRETVAEFDEPLGWAVQHPTQGFRAPRYAIVQLAEPLTNQPFQVHMKFNSPWLRGNAGRVRVSATSQPEPVPQDQRRREMQQRIEQLIRQRNTPLQVPVLAELSSEETRTTHLMKRGNFQNLGEPVAAATPEALHPFPDHYPRNRWGLAQWLMDPRNPLTARVAVNRLWARLFGRGLVLTEEDFGTQGTAPSHPLLLDWLAVEFQTHEWDVKYMLKQMVMSQTYRQSSRADAAKAADRS